MVKLEALSVAVVEATENTLSYDDGYCATSMPSLPAAATTKAPLAVA